MAQPVSPRNANPVHDHPTVLASGRSEKAQRVRVTEPKPEKAHKVPVTEPRLVKELPMPFSEVLEEHRHIMQMDVEADKSRMRTAKGTLAGRSWAVVRDKHRKSKCGSATPVHRL